MSDDMTITFLDEKVKPFAPFIEPVDNIIEVIKRDIVVIDDIGILEVTATVKYESGEIGTVVLRMSEEQLEDLLKETNDNNTEASD